VIGVATARLVDFEARMGLAAVAVVKGWVLLKVVLGNRVTGPRLARTEPCATTPK